MKMKRKRGRPKKTVVKDPIPPPSSSAPPPAPVNADDEAVFLNFVDQNINENQNENGIPNENSESVEVNGNDNFNDAQFNAEIEFSSSSGSSSSDEEDDCDSDEESSFHLSDEPVLHKRVKSVAKNYSRSKTYVDDNVNINVNAVVAAAAAAATVMPSRGGGGAYSSMSRKQLSQVSKRPMQDPPYNKRSLKSALSVIRMVMEMDEAVPFNSPVDPVTQGIPDYFSVVDMPMDFGTICSHLENGTKYMNSDDVYKDVEYIWENCRKFNEKGDYIMYLMKRVKKKFMKYWKAARLRRNIPLNSTGNSQFAPSSDHAMMHNRHEAMSVVNHLANSTHMQQGKYGTGQPQAHASSYNQHYQSHKAQPSTSQVPQYSQFRAGVDSSYTGHSHMPGLPNTIHNMERQKHAPKYPVAPMMNGSAHNQQTQPSSYLWQSQSHIGADNNHAGQLHFPPMDGPLTHDAYVPRSSMDPTLSNMNQRQVPHSLPNHSQLNESHQSRVTIAQHGSSILPQASQPLDHGADIALVSGNSLPQKPLVSHNHVYEPEHPAFPKRKKVRGPTRCRLVGDLLDGERIHVPINMLGQPVGAEASKLASFLGTVARDCKIAPLNFLDWSSMPEAHKEDMWQFVLTKFEIDPICKNWVMKSLASKWRNWKAKLKADHYNPHTTDEERLRDCNRRVHPDQWAALVAHWNTEEMQVRCAKNKANRAKQKSAHAAGSKSFARIREEEQAKRTDGKELTRGELYILTRTRKDGKPVDKTAEEMISKLREAKKQLDSDGSNGYADTFCQVMGDEKRSQIGPSPCDIYGRKPSRHSLMRMAMEAKRSANEEVKKMMSRMEAMEQKCASLETQMTAMSTSMQSLLIKMDTLLSSKQVSNNDPEDSLQARENSSSSSHAVEV